MRELTKKNTQFTMRTNNPTLIEADSNEEGNINSVSVREVGMAIGGSKDNDVNEEGRENSSDEDSLYDDILDSGCDLSQSVGEERR